MTPPVKMMLIYVDETDTWGDLALYEAIVRKLVHSDISGATVHAGIMGYGSHYKVHRKRLFGVTDDRPITIAVIENEEKLRRVIPEIRPMMEEGLIVLVDVAAVF